MTNENSKMAAMFEAWMVKRDVALPVRSEDKYSETTGERLLTFVDGLKKWHEDFLLVSTYKKFSNFVAFVNLAERGYKIDPMPSEEDYKARSTVRMAASDFNDWAKRKNNTEEFSALTDNERYLKWIGSEGIKKVPTYNRCFGIAVCLKGMGFETAPPPTLNEFIKATNGATVSKAKQQRIINLRSKKIAYRQGAMPERPDMEDRYISTAITPT